MPISILSCTAKGPLGRGYATAGLLRATLHPERRLIRPISIRNFRPSRAALAALLTLFAGLDLPGEVPATKQPDGETPRYAELRIPRMNVDVDGAPNAYGPPGRPTLDYERNAHRGGKLSGAIVGYLTERDGHTPLRQGPHDPFPGYYISTTGLRDERIESDRDTRKYLDARHVSYVVLGRFAQRRGVRLGDLAAVHSARTGRTVWAIVGDEGNASGAEGSLALLQHLGYPFRDGKEDAVERPEITIRYFAHSNPRRVIPRSQRAIDAIAAETRLSGHFESR